MVIRHALDAAERFPQLSGDSQMYQPLALHISLPSRLRQGLGGPFHAVIRNLSCPKNSAA